jgi:hypothetical protein
MQFYKDNILASDEVMKASLKGELIISPEHEALIIYSKAMDCNPHAKIKFTGEEYLMKEFGDVTVIFVPSSATITIPFKDVKTRNIVLDIRSMDMEGDKIFKVFNELIEDFSCKAVSADGKKGKIFMSNVEPFISDSVIKGKKFITKKYNITVLIDRYTLKSLDEYCSLLLAYLYSKFTVKGTPHHMSKYIYKTVRFNDGDKKISFALPVLKLLI